MAFGLLPRVETSYFGFLLNIHVLVSIVSFLTEQADLLLSPNSLGVASLLLKLFLELLNNLVQAIGVSLTPLGLL